MRLHRDSPAYDIVACLLLLWTTVFLGASLKNLLVFTSAGKVNIFSVLEYGVLATACGYASLGLIFRKKYGFWLANSLFLFVIFCFGAHWIISPVSKLPAIFMGVVGIFLLCWARFSSIYYQDE